MLSIDIRLNGQVIAHAKLINRSALADVSDYELVWGEHPAPELGIKGDGGKATITGHRRRQSVWALVAKAVVAILDHMEGDPRDIR